MANSNNINPPLISTELLKQFEEIIKKGAGSRGTLGPPVAIGGSLGRPTGSSLKDKDSIIQETVERLSEVIAKLCNRYNFSDQVKMSTEVDLVETANYTTVILTATIEWLPNPYVFVAQEKVKTSNKTNVARQTTNAVAPFYPPSDTAQQSNNLTNQLLKQERDEAAAIMKMQELEREWHRQAQLNRVTWQELPEKEPPF